jgi:hypothetical protein
MIAPWRQSWPEQLDYSGLGVNKKQVLRCAQDDNKIIGSAGKPSFEKLKAGFPR